MLQQNIITFSLTRKLLSTKNEGNGKILKRVSR